MSFKYQLNFKRRDNTSEKLLSFITWSLYSEKRWMSDILMCLILSIVTDGSTNIHHLVKASISYV